MASRQSLRRRAAGAVGVTMMLAIAAATVGSLGASRDRAYAAKAAPAREVHYTFSSPTSVTFDWVGSSATIRFGRTSRYTRKVTAHAPKPLPFSSAGPFREATLTGLKRGTTYHYSIGGGRDHTFATAPTGRFRFDVEADVGDSASASRVRPTQEAIARDKPAFVIVAGDLTYGNDNGQSAVDRHFDDVMVWSQVAAYMPAWGRFDAGPVRFISYPEPYTGATWADWRVQADRVMAAAQASKKIKFIVTFGHRPAYSTGYHPGESTLASILDGFGDKYSKYVLNLNGHSHDYERFQPIHHVVHVTAAGGGSPLETPWRRRDSRTAFRAMHLEHVRVMVTPAEIRLEAVCGPASPSDETSCDPGAVIDSYAIAAPK